MRLDDWKLYVAGYDDKNNDDDAEEEDLLAESATLFVCELGWRWESTVDPGHSQHFIIWEERTTMEKRREQRRIGSAKDGK